MSEVLLSATGLHKTYILGRRSLEVLRGVDLELRRGDFLALRGASGAGKSTLLHLLGGLDSPNQGEIRLAGRNLATLGRRDLARLRNKEVGFIFQAYYLLPELDALENVCLPARMARTAGGPGGGARARTAGARRPRRAPRAQTLRAFRRRTAARGHCPRADQRAGPRSWPTNRPATSTRIPARRSSNCCARCAMRSKPR